MRMNLTLAVLMLGVAATAAVAQAAPAARGGKVLLRQPRSGAAGPAMGHSWTAQLELAHRPAGRSLKSIDEARLGVW